MRNLKLTLILSIFISLFSNQSKSMDNRCYEFIEGIKNLEYEQDSSIREKQNFKDFGFDLHHDPIEGVGLDYDKTASKIRRNKKNYPLIGALTSEKGIENFKSNDVIISINNLDLSKLEDDKISDLIYPDEIKQFHEIIIKRDGKKLTKKIKAHEYEKEYRTFNFTLNSINKIDLKNSTVKFSATISSDREYSESVGWALVKHAKNTIVSFDEESQTLKGPNCDEIPYEYAKKNRMPISGETFGFPDLTSEDKDKVYESVSVYTYEDKNADKKSDALLNISYFSEGEWEIKNKFNLTSFPFDRQKIIINMTDSDYFDQVYFSALDTNYRILDYNKKNLKIPGWNIIDIKFNVNNNFDFGGAIYNQASIILDIERQSFYYIFKIIFPIILILFICWSSVWLDPKEVEAKLTISIVCLLSLIAYNFVIDNELPKLEYLTIMDWIILASYLYAAAPNMLAIFTFQISRKIKYRKLFKNVETISKRYGVTSYILLILIIVIINVSSVPENTIDALSWAKMR